MINLPPEIQQFAAILDAQPRPVQAAFQYAMCLLMVEQGKMRLLETLPGENGATCIFQTVTDSFTFSVTRPLISKETEAQLVEQLRAILDNEET